MCEQILANIINNTIAMTALENCIKILEQDARTIDLVDALVKRRDEIDEENEDFLDEAAGGEFDIGKAH
ncbi:MAG: hypothetical protein HFI77_10555 [Lachnospiraceae bacterium]|nr:hypothetical protein [Lachnospiraceae bacterium]